MRSDFSTFSPESLHCLSCCSTSVCMYYWYIIEMVVKTDTNMRSSRKPGCATQARSKNPEVCGTLKQHQRAACGCDITVGMHSYVFGWQSREQVFDFFSVIVVAFWLYTTIRNIQHFMFFIGPTLNLWPALLTSFVYMLWLCSVTRGSVGWRWGGFFVVFLLLLLKDCTQAHLCRLHIPFVGAA